MCFEHPGLLAPDSGPAGGTATCVTCSDEGRHGRGGRGAAVGLGRRAHRDGSEVDRHDDRRHRSRPAISSSSMPGPRSPCSRMRATMSDTGGESTAFLYPFIEGDEREVAPLLADLEQSAVAKAAASAELRAATSARMREQVAAAGRRHGGPVRSAAAGCSPSATEAARPMRHHWPRCSPGRPWGRPLPARCLVDDSAVLTALGNDVGFDLVFVAPAHRPRCSRATSPSGSRPAAAHATCSPPSPRPELEGWSRSGWPATTAARWRLRPTCSTASSCARTACTGSRRPRRRSGFALWAAVQQRLDDAGG